VKFLIFLLERFLVVFRDGVDRAPSGRADQRRPETLPACAHFILDPLFRLPHCTAGFLRNHLFRMRADSCCWMGAGTAR